MSGLNQISSTDTFNQTWTENLDIDLAHTWTENLDIDLAHTWTENLSIARA